MKSINPYSGQIIAEYKPHSMGQAESIIAAMDAAYRSWRKLSPDERCKLVAAMGRELEAQKEALAQLITNEMGKPLRESIAEIEKCALLCNHHSQPESAVLQPTTVKTEAQETYISYEPLGTIFAIMPWNFPFWQVMRFAIPNLMAGNTALLKHAPNVNGCALAIEKLFLEAGFPENVFRAIMIQHEDVEAVIANKYIKGVTLTGSGRAGKAVASLAGKHLKKSVLELGGSDPFIVFADADIGNTCLAGMRSRLMNAGQVCISAKRFLVEASVMDEFINETLSLMQNLKLGDPMDLQTDIGPMARPDLVDQIEKQLNESIRMGAKLLLGGKRHPNHPLIFEPTLITHITDDMPVIKEETFGPISVVIPFETTDEAIELANNSHFGLAASVWTNDLEKAKYVAAQLEVGGVFVNSMTKSDPRLPFGGIKNSGYGRELSTFGIKEFMNIKTNWID
jgi:succinate-semialdehyde dehydrogenase / glutarate-semialdehyde dehydrogenase